jgi:hypothetical protein
LVGEKEVFIFLLNLQKMNNFFTLVSKTKTLILLSFLVIVFNLLMPKFLSKDHALDLQFAYSPDHVAFSLNQLNAEERGLYRIGLLALDMPYLVCYGLLLSGILYRLWGKGSLVFIPVLVSLADLVENLIILRLLGIFPREDKPLAFIVSFFSTTKWILVGVVLLTVFVGLIRWFVYRRVVSVNSPKFKI